MPEAPVRRPCIIDTDPGLDDFLAIRMALRASELDVQCLTATGGNCSLELAVTNALRCVEDSGHADLPVHAGASEGLFGPFFDASIIHGDTGLPVELPPPQRTATDGHAVPAMAARLSPAAAMTTVISLGPLTNLAWLLRDHPESAERIEQVVVMGGAVDVPGNITPHAEFNIWNDPVAASIVVASGLPVRLVGLDACRHVVLEREDASQLSGMAGLLLQAWFDSDSSRNQFTMHDPLTVLAAIDPRLFTFERTPISVLESGEEQGRTQRGGDGPENEVATGVDADAARKLCMSLLM